MQQESNLATSNQFSMRDVVKFFAKYRNSILMSSVLGLASAGLYIALAPKIFEARWQMVMAKMSTNTNTNTNTNTFNNAEDPAALIQRLRSPTAYSKQALEECGYAKNEIESYLDKTLHVQVVKNVPDVVDFRLHAKSAVQLNQCANALVTMVRDQQRDIIQDRLAGRQEQLMQYQQALHDEMYQLGSINKTEFGSIGYLAKLDKLSWLRTRIDQLQEEIFLSQKHPAKLISPLEVSSKPVSPKVLLVIIFGGLLGFIIGLAFLIVREGLKSEVDQEKPTL